MNIALHAASVHFLHCLSVNILWFCPGVTKKHQKNIFEYWVFFQKSYLNMGRFENNIFAYVKFNICIPKI